MARSRRPSIGLIILFVLLLFLYLFSSTLVEYVSNWAGWGSFTYSYVAGDEPIVSISFELPQDLASAMVPKQVAGWVVGLTGNILSLTGGTLNPGGSVTIEFRLAHYIKGGTRTVTVTAVLLGGRSMTTSSSLPIPDVILLNIVEQIDLYKLWLLILACVVLIVIVLQIVIGSKKKAQITEEARAGKEVAAYAAGIMAGASAGIIAALATTDAKVPKEAALKALEIARASAAKEIVVKKLDEALGNIKQSLGPNLWKDDEHLDSRMGSIVFDEERKAVELLMNLVVMSDTPKNVSEKSQEAITILVEVDKRLAKTAYEEAKKKTSNNELIKCDSQFAEAAEAIRQRTYDRAIEHYKQAWEIAQRLIGS